MANVGNLFVNIGGNTKGLTKSLKAAKTKLLDFSSSAIKEQKKVVADAMENAAMAARGATVGARSGNLEMMTQSRIQAASSGRTYREERGKLTQMEAAFAMRAGLGVIGLTIAGAALIAKNALSRTDEAIASAKQFEMMGPEGGKILEQRIKMMLDAMKYASSPEGSAALLKQATMERSVKREALQSGAAGLRQEFSALKDESSENLIRGIFRPFQRLVDVLPVHNLRIPDPTKQITGGY